MANQIESRSADALAGAAKKAIPNFPWYGESVEAIDELAKRAAGYKPDAAAVAPGPVRLEEEPARTLGCRLRSALIGHPSTIARFADVYELERRAVAVANAHTEDTVVAAIKNLGHDVECGACMSLAFTGSRLTAHTCKQNEASRTLAALDAIDKWRDEPHTDRTVERSRRDRYYLKETQNRVNGTLVSETYVFAGTTRLECLEAAAAWCKK